MGTHGPAKLAVLFHTLTDKSRFCPQDEIAVESLPDPMELVLSKPHVAPAAGNLILLLVRIILRGPSQLDISYIGVTVELAHRL